jgi:hypothetical protein
LFVFLLFLIWGVSAPVVGLRVKDQLIGLARAIDAQHAAARTVTFETREQDAMASRAQDKIEEGHAIMYSMHTLLSKIDTAKYYRTKHQRELHLRMMAALARFIYGPQTRAYQNEIKRVNGFETLNQYIFLTAPRRGGKSEGTAQMLAVILICVPFITIIALAPSLRAVGADSGLMKKVKEWLIKLGETKFEKDNKDVISIKRGENDIRTFHAYPGGSGDK